MKPPTICRTEDQREAQLQSTALAAAGAQTAQDAALAAERRQARLIYRREYTKRPDFKAKRREYARLPEVKEARNARLKIQRAEIRLLKLRSTASLHGLPMDSCSHSVPESPHPARWAGFVVG